MLAASVKRREVLSKLHEELAACYNRLRDGLQNLARTFFLMDDSVRWLGIFQQGSSCTIRMNVSMHQERSLATSIERDSRCVDECNVQKRGQGDES